MALAGAFCQKSGVHHRCCRQAAQSRCVLWRLPRATSLISASFAFRLVSLPLALASLVLGCGAQLSLDEAGLLDAVAFVTGGQHEGAVPQGFETRWRRTVHEREIKYQSIGPYAGFGQANDPHRDSRRVRIGVTITSPTKCMFKTVVTTEYSRGASGESFGDATNEVATLDFNKVRRFDIENGNSPSVVIEGAGWMCKQGGCQDIVRIGISAPRQEEARAIESKRHAMDFIKRACPPRPDSPTY